MYEEITYEGLLKTMLSAAKDSNPNIDTREGSVVWYGLAPAAVEMKNLYLALDEMLDETFADTASRECLVRRAAERGLSPYPAEKAVAEGVFTPASLSVPIGARFGRDGVYFRTAGKTADGVYRLECDTAGEAGNVSPGALLPVDYIDGLGTATLTEILIPGEDEEDTEAFRKRYFSAMDAKAYGVNAADYREKVGALAGVGGVKVEPAWNGGGTVRLVLIDAALRAPSEELIASVQDAVDPSGLEGEGAGIAPIGHVVTVQGVEERQVAVGTTLVYQDGWGWEDVRPYAEAAVDEYFLELAKSWAGAENPLVVRISQIDNRLLNLAGVMDVGGTTLNGYTENLTLGQYQIPVRGEMHG